MKLLLTSGGIRNQSIAKALEELANKPLSQLKITFIPTASNLESGNKDWLIDDLRRLSFLGFAEIDIVDVSALPQSVWEKRLKQADVLFVEGGNTYHLMYWLNQSGLSEILPEFLKSKIYVGVSAGTIVTTPSLINADFEKKPAQDIGDVIYDQGLGLVDFMIEPHVNSTYFPESNFENLEKRSKKYSYPIYGLDDNSAIKIDDNKIEVVSEGVWKKFN
jgi:dipeptidase E